LRLLELAQFRGGQKAVGEKLIERARAEVAFGHPRDRLDIAQAAGPGLDVGLEVVRGIVGLEMAVLLLGHFGLEVCPHRPHPIGGHGFAHGA
jgi:hypothetical protein